MLSNIWIDLILAGRSLAKARAFTFVCVVSLGMGIAAVAVLIAVVASLAPARRAASVQPMAAMRSE
jgi:ABC-type lipoprotein release transport system permease subunit